MTWHEKIVLMCANNTPSDYSTYLNLLYTSYTNSVNVTGPAKIDHVSAKISPIFSVFTVS